MIYDVEFFFLKRKFERLFSFFFIWEFTKQILIRNYRPKGGLIKPKVAKLYQFKSGGHLIIRLALDSNFVIAFY
jgi:hypothetical protein